MEQPKERTFESSAPAALALTLACVKAKLLVAPSSCVLGASGLYATRAFAKGELLCHGVSMRNGWEPAEELPASPTSTLQLLLRHMFFHTRDEGAQLVGDPSRHLWTAMNSTEGLSGESCADPNVEAVFGDENAVEMNNSFLAFRAARDIGAFEELVWRYAWAADAPAAKGGDVEESDAPKQAEEDDDDAPLAELGVKEESVAPEQAAAATDSAPAAEEGHEEESVAPDAEVLRTDGREIASAGAVTVYFYSGEIIVVFAKFQKKMPKFSVTALSNSCRSTNAWQKVEYDLTPKSKVEVNGEIVKLKDSLGKNISHVWGYEACDCKQRRGSSGEGEVKSLFWAPKSQDMAMCDALMNLDDVQPVFVMEVKSTDDGPTMTPEGVTFTVKSRHVEAALKASTNQTYPQTLVLSKI